MSRQKDREAFVVAMEKEGIPLEVSRALMRHEATLHRLSEAACNGDWPADNGERQTQECGRCKSAWAPSVIQWARDTPRRLREGKMSVAEAVGTGLIDYVDGGKVPGFITGRFVHKYRICPDCATEDRVRALLAPYLVEPVFNGDPRGSAILLKVPSGRTDDWGQRGICVP